MSDSAQFLLTHFDRLAEAPGGIAKLRALLLQLGVQGKLTQQDPADLLAAKIVGKFRKPKLPFAPIEDGELPFQIPATWVWARLGACMELFNGRAFKPTDWSTEGLRIVRIKNLNDENAPFNHCNFPVEERRLIHDDDFLISWSGTPGTSFGAFIWKRGKAVLNQHIFRAELSSPELYKPYMRLAVNSRLDELISKAHGGVGLQHVTKPTLEFLPLPIPPLAEQRRIVAKVEELMGLCDALEAAQREREAVRTRLRTSALHQLASPDSDSNSAAFVLEHLQLFTPASEDLLVIRRLVLDFAISGNLIEQKPSEEHASKLHARLVADIKSHAGRSGISEHTSAIVADDEAPWPSPAGWVWTRLSGLFHVITDGDHQPPPKADDGIAFLTIGNITTGSLDFSDCRFVPKKYWDALPLHRRPSYGDILYTVVGATYGRPALVDTKREFCVQRHVAILKPAKETDIKFLMLFLASRFAYDQATRSITGTAQPTVPLRPLRNFLVPLPPLAEQRRIVAKVDELMAVLCALEAALTTARTTAEQLLAATVAGLHAA